MKRKVNMKITLIILIVIVLLLAFFIGVEIGYNNIVKDGCTPCYYSINNIEFGCCDSIYNIFQKIVIVITYYIK